LWLPLVFVQVTLSPWVIERVAGEKEVPDAVTGWSAARATPPLAARRSRTAVTPMRNVVRA
jgi:hypothetical protein